MPFCLACFVSSPARRGRALGDHRMIFRNISHRQFLSGFGQGIAFLLLILTLGLFGLHRINFVTADLGRHIKNGEIFLKEGRIVSTNYYSFTEPDRPVINHHWGAGVIFYLLWRQFDFKGLSYFYTAIFLVSFLLFFSVAKDISGFSLAYFFSILSLPLIVSRPELRPEGLSYLFLAIFVFFLHRYKTGRVKPEYLAFLILIQIAWVNTHIFFFLGPLVISFFLLEAWCQKREKKDIRNLFILLGAALVACWINPFGIEGALSPFTILKEYGYMLAENQSVPFMQKRFSENPVYLHFEIIFAVMLVGFVIVVRKKNVHWYILNILLLGFVSVLAWKAVRALVLFGFLFIPFTSGIYADGIKRFSHKTRQVSRSAVFLLGVLIIIFGLISRNFYYSPYRTLGLSFLIEGIEKSPFWMADLIRRRNQLPGLVPGVNRSAEFFNKLHIEGPVFNNYDIGGYLIFHLFPRHKVFVDNRPEAYSVSFFKDVYVPMQEDEAVWAEMLKRHSFNAIYFFRQDMTPWAQPFLIRRIQDPEWAPVFVDYYTLILLRRNQRNKDIIRRYELPRSIFKITSQG
ncbi:MAG TPA: hypothetical protein DD723_00125 [Candidatus Omnitrophica bacterium]|nr:MAG: hypothetical protein A2Z81_07205 [Omnitrophica WOR_2 bacterium GWA2_45_18]HBR13941.1 hypothetical protein [Candidatus Omnitrophota bacterium]